MADPAVLAAVCADLVAEQAALDEIVSPLSSANWALPTPAPGWTVRDQIGHLAWFDERAIESVTAPDVFVAGAEALLADLPASLERPVEIGRALPPDALLAWWRGGRVQMLTAFASLDPSTRLPWYGPPMGAVSFVTARLMETWAHGQDVVDALGASRVPTARLRHVAHIGVGAMGFSYQIRGLQPPNVPVRVELVGPGGEEWGWGPKTAADRVRGPALDFCLVVTQRRHLDDTELEVQGSAATEWMGIAQAFAGPPGEGRQPGQFAVDP